MGKSGPRPKLNRIGEEYFNKKGEHFVITNYKSATDLEVTFDNGYVSKTSYRNAIEGYVKNRALASIESIGIIGNMKSYESGKPTKEYQCWHDMIVRCFSERSKKEKPTYKDVSCCKEWLVFENFYNWLQRQENYQILKNSNVIWNLDKDILVKGNKIYSPETCCLVPKVINTLLLKPSKTTNIYPIGVGYDKNWKYFYSYCWKPDGTRSRHTGFKNPMDAFLQYKKDKEQHVREIALRESKKGYITKKCYEALMRFEVVNE